LNSSVQFWNRMISRAFLALLAVVATANLAACQSGYDVDWLIEELELQEGSVVADIGAGDGDQSVAIARHVGPEGQVYSTELGAGMVRQLRRKMEREELTDVVTVREGDPGGTNLPEECCDAIYMRRVYHHINDPAAFNRSLLATLKPGGRLAIIDFEPRGEEAEPRNRASAGSHGVTAESVIRELQAAGFELVSNERRSGRNIYIVMRKPE